MLGHQHFTLSTATGVLVVLPFLPDYRIEAILAIVGISIGCLIPDVDASGTAVFHGRLEQLDGRISKDFARLLSPVLPIFGYFTRYLIYRPSVRLLDYISEEYNFEEKHRGFSHSMLGITIFVFSTGLLLLPFFSYLDSTRLLVYFLAGYASGALLHIVQDSFTRSGIAWNQPFSSFKLRGQITTGKDSLRPQLFLATILSFILLRLAPISWNILQYGAWNGLVLAVVSWFFFAVVSGVRPSR